MEHWHLNKKNIFHIPSNCFCLAQQKSMLILDRMLPDNGHTDTVWIWHNPSMYVDMVQKQVNIKI